MARAEISQELTEPFTQKREGLLRYVNRAALPAVVLLAMALRLYRLRDQSLWLDDFFLFRHLHAPDLLSYLTLGGMQVPEQIAAPLYYVIQYYVGKWTGMNVEAMRLLPVAFGVSAVPLLYGFVRYLCGAAVRGRSAALVAALCLALSPQHIWHAQEIRPYELVTPLVIISAWTFLRGYREGRRVWWAANLITNTLLAWTHLFTVFLILAEGLFLLAFSLRRFRRVVAWSLVQLFLLVPSVISVLWMPYSHHLTHLGRSAWDVFNNILCCDIVRYHTDILPAWKTHPAGAATATFPSLIPLCPWFDGGLLAVFIGASAWAVVRLIRSLWQWSRARAGTRGADPPQASRRELENMVFLLLLLLVPGLTLALIDISLNRTALCPMYSMYNQMALYAIVGAALMALPGAWWRRGAVLGIIGLYAFQLLVLLPEVTRTNWKGAAAYIRNNASSTDEILQIEHFWLEEDLAFYLSPGWPVHQVWSFQAACDDSARILQAVSSTTPDNGQKRVWIVVQPTWLRMVSFPRFDSAAVLRQALQERGLKPSFKEFPGHLNVLVCMVERSEAAVCNIGGPVQPIQPLPVIWEERALLRPIDYDEVLDELGFQGCDEDQRSRLSAALRESVDHWPLDRFPACSQFMSIPPLLDLARRGHCDLAEALARYVIAQYPDFGLLHMALGIVLLKEREIPAAQAAFATALKLHRGLGHVLAPFLDALARNDDPEAVRNEIRRLERSGFAFAPALRDACLSGGPSGVPIHAAQPLDEPINKNGGL